MKRDEEMDKKTCETCKHYTRAEWEDPCRDCQNSKLCLWESAEVADEPEEKKRTKEDTEQAGVTFKEFKKRMREAKESSPRPLPMPVCISGPEDGRLPELIRVSFDDGTTAVYRLKEAENDQLIIKSIEIIRKWNRPRRRRDRQP